MRAKIFLIFLLALSNAIASRDLIIMPIFSDESKIRFSLTGSNNKALNDVLNDPDPRTCVEISVDSVPMHDVQRIFEVYGKQATKLVFKNSNNISYKAQDVVNAFNMLTNLEELSLMKQQAKFEGDPEGTLTLKNLNKVGIDSEIGLDFMAKALPENILKVLQLNGDETIKNCDELLSKQRSIKDLILHNINPTFNPAINSLSLEKFTFFSRQWDEDDEFLPNRRKFIKDVIESQSNLKGLDLYKGYTSIENIMDQELLQEVSKLAKLETFDLVLDGLSNLEGLEKLKNLKDLTLLSYEGKSTAVQLLNELSNFKYESLKVLTILCSGFDHPEATYERMSQNLPNLKKLTFNRSYHTINFYARTFPQIEDLTTRFGTYGEPIYFEDAFDRSDKVVHQNLKKLKVEFRLRLDQVFAVDDFVEFLKMFPNLESLEIDATFAFSNDFVRKLDENTKNLKFLKLKSIEIKKTEKFRVESSNALKALASKLDYIKLKFVQNDRKVKNSAIKSFIDRLFEREEEEVEFSYQPLIDAVKDVFKYDQSKNFLGKDVLELTKEIAE